MAGDAAVLVDPHDVDAMLSALVDVLTDPTEHQRLRIAGLARCRPLSPGMQWAARSWQSIGK